MQMNRLVQSILVIITTVVLAVLVWFFISKEFAWVLVGLLAGRLIDQIPAFQKKEDESKTIPLQFRIDNLSPKLQEISTKLSDNQNVGSAAFEAVAMYSAIEKRGLMKALEVDSTLISELFGDLEERLREIETEADKKIADSSQGGIVYKPEQVKEELVHALVYNDRKIRELCEEIDLEIENILGKYGGIHK